MGSDLQCWLKQVAHKGRPQAAHHTMYHSHSSHSISIPALLLPLPTTTSIVLVVAGTSQLGAMAGLAASGRRKPAAGSSNSSGARQVRPMAPGALSVDQAALAAGGGIC